MTWVAVPLISLSWRSRRVCLRSSRPTETHFWVEKTLTSNFWCTLSKSSRERLVWGTWAHGSGTTVMLSFLLEWTCGQQDPIDHWVYRSLWTPWELFLPNEMQFLFLSCSNYIFIILLLIRPCLNLSLYSRLSVAALICSQVQPFFQPRLWSIWVNVLMFQWIERGKCLIFTDYFCQWECLFSLCMFFSVWCGSHQGQHGAAESEGGSREGQVRAVLFPAGECFELHFVIRSTCLIFWGNRGHCGKRECSKKFVFQNVVVWHVTIRSWMAADK